MSDRVRIVRLHQPSGRLWVERDLEIEYGKYQRAAGTFRISASAPTLATAEQSRARLAPRTYGRTDPARTASGTWRVRGNTYGECIANAEAILAAVDSGRMGRMIEWRPDGHTVSTLLKVTGPGAWTSNYTWHQFFQNRSIDFDLSWPVEPVSYDQPWDVYDEFGPLADDSVNIDAQLLVNTNGASPLDALGPSTGYKTSGTANFVDSINTQDFGVAFSYGGWDTLSGAGIETDYGDPGTGTWTVLAPDPAAAAEAFRRSTVPVTPGKWYALRARVKTYVPPSPGATFGPLSLVAAMFGPGPGAGVEQPATLMDAGGLAATTPGNITAALNDTNTDLCGIVQIPTGIDRLGVRIQVDTVDTGASGGVTQFISGNLGVWPISGPTATIPGDPYVTGDSDGWRWTGDRNLSGWTRIAESKLQEWTYPVGRKGAIARERRNLSVEPDTRDSLPWEWLAIHDGRNVPNVTDDLAAVEFTVPPTPEFLSSAPAVGVVHAYKNSNDYLLCQLEQPAAGTWKLRLYYKYGATFNLLDETGFESIYTAPAGLGVEPGYKYTIEVTRRGSMVLYRLVSRYGLEVFGAYNAPADSAFPTAGGKAGIRVAGPPDNSVNFLTIHSFTREPLTYEYYDLADLALFTPYPHAWTLPALPGDPDGPPALADFRFTPMDPTVNGGVTEWPIEDGTWACLAWAARDGGYNMLGVGSFDEEGTGTFRYTFSAARAPVAAGATILGTNAWAPTPSGRAALGIRTTAVDQGAWLDVPGPFLAGRTYRMTSKLLGLPYDQAAAALHGTSAIGNLGASSHVTTTGTTASSAIGTDTQPAPPNRGASPTYTKIVADGTATNQGRSFSLGTLAPGFYRVRLWVRNLTGDAHLTVGLGKTTTPFETVSILANSAISVTPGWTEVDQYVSVTAAGDYVLYVRHDAATPSTWVTFSELVQRIDSPLATTLTFGRYDSGDSESSLVAPYQTTFTGDRWLAQYQQFYVDWTPTTDYDRAYIAIRRTQSGTDRRDLEVDSLQVYEQGNGLRAPQGAGADGYAPIGRIPAAPYLLSNVSGNWQNGTVPGSLKYLGPADGLHTAPAGGSIDPDTDHTSGIIEWPIDPSTVLPAEGDDDLTVEVYACYTASSTESTALRAHLQLRGSYGIGSYQDAQPWGTAGRPLLKPASGTNAQKYSRLGTLTMSGRDRKWLRFWISYHGAPPAVTGDRFQLNYLCLVPIHQRACLPTGKPNIDGLYPRWVGGGFDWERIWRSDLTGAENWRDQHRGGPAPALGGEPVELPTGRPLWFMPWLTHADGGVPDGPATDPFAQGEGGADVPGGRWHLAITPRRNLLVPDERG